MEQSSTTVEHLPLELINRALGNLDFWGAKNARASCKLFREGAAFNRKTMAKPIFDMTLIYSITPNGPAVMVHLKLLNEDMEYKRRYTLMFGDQREPGVRRFGLRHRHINPIPAGDDEPVDEVQATRNYNEEFIRKFFPKMSGFPAPYDEFFEVTKDFFMREAVIRCLDFKEEMTLDFCIKLAQLLSACPADKLVFNGPIWIDQPPMAILKCTKSTGFLEHMTITREFLNELLQLRINKWVSVKVDSWFDDATLVSLPFKTLPQLHFRGPHSVTFRGIRPLVLSFFHNATNADAPQWTEVDAGHLSLAHLGGNSGLFMGERAFDIPDLNRCKDVIDRLAEHPGVSVTLTTVATHWPLSMEHYLVEGPRGFIRIFTEVPHFTTGIRFLFFLKTW